MRLGSAQSYDQSLESLVRRQADLSRSQQQISSGKKITNASDDPLAAAQIEKTLTRMERLQVSQRALASQREALLHIETELGTATELLQRFRELTVQAGNVGLSGSDRSSLVFEMQGLRDQLLVLANRVDTHGQALFGSLGSPQRPFSANAQGVSFNAISGQWAPRGDGLPSTLDGQALFEGQVSIFSTFDTLMVGIDQAGSGAIGLSQTLNQGLSQLDLGIDRFLSARALVGSWLNRADAINGAQESSALGLESQRSRLEDVDLVQAVSDLNSQQLGYEAALKSYAQIQRLSLFNYLS